MPNNTNPEANKPTEFTGEKPDVRLTRRGKFVVRAAGVGLAGLGLLAGGSAIAENSEKTNDNMVQIVAPDDIPAWNLAAEVKSDYVSQREVSDIISKQADDQGYPGVEQGEVYTLSDEFVSEEAEKELAPRFTVEDDNK